MPRVSVYLIRLALVHLVVGATLGTLLLIQKATPIHDGIWILRSIHMELLLFGFVIQLAIGVAVWILPRNKETVRHSHSWAAAGLLNLGVWVAAIGGAALGWGLALTIGRVLEAAALVIFSRVAWPRIRAFRG